MRRPTPPTIAKEMEMGSETPVVGGGMWPPKWMSLRSSRPLTLKVSAKLKMTLFWDVSLVVRKAIGRM